MKMGFPFLIGMYMWLKCASIFMLLFFRDSRQPPSEHHNAILLVSFHLTNPSDTMREISWRAELHEENEHLQANVGHEATVNSFIVGQADGHHHSNTLSAAASLDAGVDRHNPARDKRAMSQIGRRTSLSGCFLLPQ
jgi:hypothetical protein